MKKVLFVAYIFPPTATTGVHRSAKFVQHLPEYGWQPIVLTSANCVYVQQDPASLAEIPSSVQIIGVSVIEPEHVRRLGHNLLEMSRLAGRFGKAWDWRVNRFFERTSFPDMHAPWAKKAISVAERICARYSVDAVITTSWPYSSHLIGLHLSRKFGLPWVADFRDPWLDSSAYNREGSSPLATREAALERDIINYATAISCTSSTTVTAFHRRYQDTDPGKFRLVRNGFDPAHVRIETPDTTRTLRIAYIGAFYRFSTPETLAKALERLAEDSISLQDIEFLMVGDMGGTEQVLEEHGVTPYFHLLGRLPANRCYQVASSCQVLWLYLHDGDRFVVPGKTYEYLAANRWILASVPLDSEVALLLRDAGDCATLVAPDDVEGTVKALKELLRRHREGSLVPSYVSGYVEQFTRRAQTEKLAEVLYEITPEGTL